MLFVRRLRLAARRPIFVCDSHLPVTRFPMLKDADYEAISLSRLFEERIGRKIVAFYPARDSSSERVLAKA